MFTTGARAGRGAIATAVAAILISGGLLGPDGPSGAAASPYLSSTGSPSDGLAPLVGLADADAIEGRYIVVMKDRVSRMSAGNARETAVANGSRITRDYRSALTGFAARLTDSALRELRADPAVAYIEADRLVAGDVDQPDATWGIDRVDQRRMPLSSTYHYDITGSGVTAYIIDSGLLSTHSQFTGRTAPGFSALGGDTTDCNGHGTHVAGTVGGTKYGVAKRVTLVPVRVFPCDASGPTSDVIAGVDWVAAHHTTGPAVANMSLGGSTSSALDAAVNGAISDGVFVAVSAGNNDTNACNQSPARTPAAVTVASTTSYDMRSEFSNKGRCVDLFAPGSDITSAGIGSTSATAVLSGTSMATPHVTGAAALYLQRHPTASPSTVAAWLTSNATTGVVTDAGTGSPNRLLHTSEVLNPTDPPAPPPGNVLTNPSFEAGTPGWRATPGVITNNAGRPPRIGEWKAWMSGYGTRRSDTLSQRIQLPADAVSTLSFYLRIDSSEGTTSTVFDRLRVQIVSDGEVKTVKTYSNLDESSYALRSFRLRSYVGKRVTIKFVSIEDSSLQTSFVIDDASVR